MKKTCQNCSGHNRDGTCSMVAGENYGSASEIGNNFSCSNWKEIKICERCKIVHYGPNFDEELIIKQNAQKLAKQVDDHIMKSILNGNFK